MRKYRLVLYTFMAIHYLGCSNSVDRQLYTWDQRLCCPLKDIKIKTIEYNMANGITILFCQHLDTEMTVGLIKKDDRGAYDEIFSLRSNGLIKLTTTQFGRNLPTGFLGEYSSTIDLPNGDYRLYIATHSSCGEIIFSLNKGEMKNAKYSCISRCE